MSLSLTSQVAFGDTEGLLDFYNVHDIKHRSINEKLQSLGNGVMSIPLGEPGDSWLEDHYQIHFEIASRIGQDIDDLSQADLTNPEQFDDWMARHDYFHTQIDQALGLI